MSNQHIKLVGTKNPSTDYTAEYKIGDESNPKVVKIGEPIQLDADEKALVESLGGVFVDSNAGEREEYEKSQESSEFAAGTDVAGSAPIIGNPGGVNQSVADPSETVAPVVDEKPASNDKSAAKSDSSNGKTK